MSSRVLKRGIMSIYVALEEMSIPLVRLRLCLSMQTQQAYRVIESLS